jgi:SNF2 family DNA or RNA helicase
MAQDPDPSPDPAHLEHMEAVQDEIALYEGMLASLVHSVSYGECGDDLETKESIRDTQATLKGLRRQLRDLQSPPQLQHSTEMQSTDNLEHLYGTATPASSATQNSLTHSSSRSDHLMPPPTHEPSFRKRQRNDYDYEHDEPESKSRRTTPNLSAAPSPTPSTDSFDSFDFSDEPFLASIFGKHKAHGAAREQKYLHQLEERKKREQLDAEFAQQLSQELNTDSTEQKTQISSNPTNEYSQLFLRTNGSINHQPPSVKSESGFSSGRQQTSFAVTNCEPWRRTPIKSDTVSPSPSTPTIRIKSESTPRSAPVNFTTPATTGRIPSHMKTYERIKTESGRYQSTQNVPAMTMPAAPNTAPPGMPGAFPGSQPYVSAGGSSVYNSTPYNRATSALGAASQSNFSLYDIDNLSSRTAPYTVPGFEYADPTKTKEELEEPMKHIRPDEELTQDELIQPPHSLKATLMPHQLKGLAWMRKMEEGSNKGGILADDMGLGKTVQSIALILDRPPAPGSHRPTLIVAPVALMQQWDREINKMVKTRYRLNTYIYRGSSKKVSWAALKTYDVVLTTYGLLAAELKRQLAWEEKLKLVPDAQPSATEQCSILGNRSHFHRIILDEAQNIKNRMAKAAIATCRIKADHRWALSGTPMQNNVEEMYSLVKFCRIRPYNDWAKFSKDIAGPIRRKGKARYASEAEEERAMQTLQALLRAILLRRTKQSTIDGKPILQLPPKTTSEERIAFGEDELIFYKALESNAQIQFNKFLQNGTGGNIGKNYSNALVLLLRLRQACCHPRLVVDSNDFMVQVAGSLSPDDLMNNAAELDPRVVARLKGLDAFECPICMDGTENPVVFPCGHTLCNDCLSRLVDQFTNNEEDGRPSSPTCPHCRAKIDSKKITDITSFLRVHDPTRSGIPSLDEAEEDDDEDSQSEDDEEEEEEEEDSDLDGFVVPDDFEDGSDSALEKRRGKKASMQEKTNDNKKSKSRKIFKPKVPLKSLAVLRKEGLRNKAAKRQYLKRLRKTFHPSAKTTKTVQLLEEIKARGENEKTIVFSNFTSFLDLLEVPLYDHKDFRNYVRYDGSMSSNDRNSAVLEFTDNPHCNVILVSLKAGNAGLNLTAANHVVMLDPFWNPFVEYQAADRCYRIGQLRDVTVHRVLISGDGFEGKTEEQGFTVEDRILNPQEKKRQLVETALDESAGRNVARLGVRELGYLFGLNRM